MALGEALTSSTSGAGTGRASGGSAAPGPRGYRLLGSLLDVRRDRIGFVTRAHGRFGDLVAFRMGPRRLYLCSHPEHFRHVLAEAPYRYVKGLGLDEARPLLGDGLLSSDDAVAASHRQHLREAFHQGRLDEYGGAMASSVDALVRSWRPAARRGEPVDMGREMTALTMAILGDTLLGTDLRPDVDRVSADLATLGHWAMRRMAALVRLPLGFPTPRNRRAREALRRLEALARAILADRLANPSGEPDLLGLLLGLGEAGNVDERLVRDQLLTFLLAGHETTAAALAWTWHLLARHPEVDGAVVAEIRAVVGGRPPRSDDLPRLHHVRALVQEAMRLHPPVWLIPRRAIATDELSGHRVPPESDVLLCVYTLHRHPDLWERPAEFRPERFLEEGATREPYSYLPFGAGARACLGARFSMLEASLTVAAVLQRYRLEAVGGAEEVAADASLTLRPAAPIWVRLRERRP